MDNQLEKYISARAENFDENGKRIGKNLEIPYISDAELFNPGSWWPLVLIGAEILFFVSVVVFAVYFVLGDIILQYISAI